MRKVVRRKAPPSPLVVDALKQLEHSLGGRAAVVSMLALAPMTPDLEYLLGTLGDPKNQQVGLATLCAERNILPGDLITQITQAAFAQGKALAAQEIGKGAAAVAKDVMRRAAPYEEACTTCMVDGRSTGRVTPDPTPAQPNPAPEMCPDCKGALRLVHLPQLDRQKLAMEMAHLLPKGGGLTITNQQLSVTAGAGGGTLGFNFIDQVQQLADEAIYGSSARGLPEPAVEAEVLAVEPPE